MRPSFYKSLFIAVVSLFSFSSKAQFYNVTWGKELQVGKAMDVCPAYTNGFVTAGRGTGTNAHPVNKFDDTGAVMWSMDFSEDPDFESIIRTADNHYVAAGPMWSQQYDFASFITKFDSSGVIWETILWEGMGERVTNCVFQTADGGYILAGSVLNTNVPGDHGGWEGWLYKLNDTGGLVWQKAYGGTDGDVFSSVIQTSDGGFLILGSTNSADGDLSGVTGWGNVSAGNLPIGDSWLVKTDALGNITWQKRYGGIYADEGHRVIQTQDGNYLLLASTHGAGPGGNVSAPKGDWDIWVAKIDIVGNIIWERACGGSGYERAYKVKEIFNGNYIVTGSFGTTIDGDLLCSATPWLSGSWGWIFSIDNSGQLTWQKQFSGNGQAGVLPTDSNGLLVVGNNLHPKTTFTQLDTASSFSCDSALAVINAAVKNNSISVYPTITSGQVNIELPDGYDVRELYCTDLMGRKFVPQQIEKSARKTVVSLEGLPAAIYMLSISNKEERQTFKIVYQP